MRMYNNYSVFEANSSQDEEALPLIDLEEDHKSDEGYYFCQIICLLYIRISRNFKEYIYNKFKEIKDQIKRYKYLSASKQEKSNEVKS